MTLGERLKKARQSLQYTQKQMAAALGTNQQTWQVYESGSSVPGGKVLELLAKRGFNINWLLTGEGDVWEDRCIALTKDKRGNLQSVAKRIRIVRGTMSSKEFAASLNVNEDEIGKYEDGEYEPHFSFLHLLSQKYHVNPEWLLNGEGTINKVSVPLASDFDLIRLIDTYDLIIDVITTNGLNLDTINKACILKTLYKEYSKDKETFNKESLKKGLHLIVELLSTNIGMRSRGDGQ